MIGATPGWGKPPAWLPIYDQASTNQDSGSWYRFSRCFERIYPEFDNLLPIFDSLFVSIAVRFASWNLRNGDNICFVRHTPLNHHGVVIVLLIHLAPPLTF